ncbi:MAG: NADH-quinone oxidoreductase subunit NuoH [Candidatus Riflebacteria bacterium]|nr:NADH-quinone oxidoreductase subunit NuoH [Candidatus Riflebacteria bacterium]
MVAKVIVIPVVLMQAVPLMVWVERRGSAFIQDRLGPCRAQVLGFRFWGLLHLLADAVKVISKESIIPTRANRFYFLLAPILVVVTALMAYAVIPVADTVTWSDAKGRHEIAMSAAQVDGGIVYVFAIASLGVLGIMLAGWSSGSKYPLLGALRVASQMLSYEVSLGLSLVGALLIYGSLDPNEIVRSQGHLFLGVVPWWGILFQPIGFILFLVVGFAECNRTPFDLPEGESELVAGYHTEYSGMKFSLFYLGEYVAMMTFSSLLVTVYLGGWQVPWLPTQRLVALGGPLLAAGLQIGAFVAKVALFMWLFVWVRWTVPRFRYDQLMRLGWKVILPLSLANIAVTALVAPLLLR